MSKKVKKENKNVREPWEQSIYDTEKESGSSRVEKRHQKKGNTVFLTILVVLLLLIIAFPIGTWLFISRDKKSTDSTPSSSQVSSSLVQSTSSESAENSSSSSDLTSSSSSNEQVADDGDSNQTPTEDADAVYTTVLDGEGFQQVAARNGITVEQLEQLNGMSSAETIYPGDQLRVK